MRRIVVIAILLLVAGSAVAWAQTRFADVPSTHPHAVAIERAVAEGWFVGYPDNTFRPDQTLTPHQATAVFSRVYPNGVSRAEFASFLVAGEAGLATTDSTTTPPSTTSTTTVSTIPITTLGNWDSWTDGRIQGARVEGVSDEDGAWDPILWVFCDTEYTARAPGVFFSVPWSTPDSSLVGYSFGLTTQAVYDYWEGGDGTSVWPSATFRDAFVETDEVVLFVVLTLEPASLVAITFDIEDMDEVREEMSCF